MFFFVVFWEWGLGVGGASISVLINFIKIG